MKICDENKKVHYTLRIPTDLHKDIDIFNIAFSTIPKEQQDKLNTFFDKTDFAILDNDVTIPIPERANNFAIIKSEGYFRLLEAMITKKWELIDRFISDFTHDASKG